MKSALQIKHWSIDSMPKILDSILDEFINIAIYERNIDHLTEGIERFLEQDLQFQSSGNIDYILSKLKEGSESIKPLIDDIENLLNHFAHISGSKSMRLILATVVNDMCTRFHTDVNDLRLLCTYYGPGTQWLKEENINRDALNSFEGNEEIVRNEDDIQHIPTGAVAIIKGSIYSHSKTFGAVHKSPSIMDSGKKRLILRIDTN